MEYYIKSSIDYLVAIININEHIKNKLPHTPRNKSFVFKDNKINYHVSEKEAFFLKKKYPSLRLCDHESNEYDIDDELDILTPNELKGLCGIYDIIIIGKTDEKIKAEIRKKRSEGFVPTMTVEEHREKRRLRKLEESKKRNQEIAEMKKKEKEKMKRGDETDYLVDLEYFELIDEAIKFDVIKSRNNKKTMSFLIEEIRKKIDGIYS